jgi:hypothetical protein
VTEIEPMDQLSIFLGTQGASIDVGPPQDDDDEGEDEDDQPARPPVDRISRLGLN